MASGGVGGVIGAGIGLVFAATAVNILAHAEHNLEHEQHEQERRRKGRRMVRRRIPSGFPGL